MSVQSEINRISGNVSDALDAIEDKGVTIPSGSNSDDLAGLIALIPNGATIVDTIDSGGGIVRTLTMSNVERDHEILSLTVTPYGTNPGTVTAEAVRCGDVISLTMSATPNVSTAPGNRFACADIGNLPSPSQNVYAVSLADSSVLIGYIGSNGRAYFYVPTEHVGSIDSTYTRYFTCTYIYRGDE